MWERWVKRWKVATQPAGIVQSVELWATRSKVTLGSHSNGSLIIPRYKIGTRSRLGNSELTLGIHYLTESAGNDGSTLALKPIDRVNRSPKQRASVAPQNGDLSPQKLKEKKCKSVTFQKYHSDSTFPTSSIISIRSWILTFKN